MLPKQALHSSVYAASSPEENNIIDPYAMSNTPSPTGTYLQPSVCNFLPQKYSAVLSARGSLNCWTESEFLDSAISLSMTAISLFDALIWGWAWHDRACIISA